MIERGERALPEGAKHQLRESAGGQGKDDRIEFGRLDDPDAR